MHSIHGQITMGWKCITVSSIFIEHQFFNTVVINNVILKVNCKTKEEDCNRISLVSLIVKNLDILKKVNFIECTKFLGPQSDEYK